jgi:hypothetical protein
LFLLAWSPAFERVKKSKWRQSSPLVMAMLDTAIQEKPKHFNSALDGRVKPTAVRIVLLAIVSNVIPEIALAIAGNPYRSLHML